MTKYLDVLYIYVPGTSTHS